MIDFALDCTRLILGALTGVSRAVSYGNIDGMEGIPYVKPWKTVLVKRGAATVLYLVVAFVVAGIVELLGKI